MLEASYDTPPRLHWTTGNDSIANHAGVPGADPARRGHRRWRHAMTDIAVLAANPRSSGRYVFSASWSQRSVGPTGLTQSGAEGGGRTHGRCEADVFAAPVISQAHDTHARRAAPPARGARDGAPRHHASGRGARGRGRVGPVLGPSSVVGPVAARGRSFGTSRSWTASRWPSWALPVPRSRGACGTRPSGGRRLNAPTGSAMWSTTRDS